MEVWPRISSHPVRARRRAKSGREGSKSWLEMPQAVMWIMYSSPGLLLRAAEKTDIPGLAEWFSDHRVLEWYGGRDRPLDAEGVRQKFFSRSRDPATGRFHEFRACIVESGETGPHGWEGDTAIAFVQYERLAPSEAGALGYPPRDRTYGFDLLIGIPELWGQGFGTRVIELIRDYLCEMRGAARVVADPRVDNRRSVRAFQKAYFRKVRSLPAREVHEGVARDCWLMEYP